MFSILSGRANEPENFQKGDFSKEVLSNLYKPFERQGVVMFLNLADRNPENAQSSTLGNIELNETLEQAILPLGARSFLLSNGNCVMDRKLKDEIASYAAYAETYGLVDPGSLEQVIFVDDFLNFHLVFKTLAERELKAVVYRESREIHGVAEAAGAEIFGGSGPETAAHTNDLFYHKGRYQQKLAEYLEPPFPRMSVIQDEQLSPERAWYEFNEAIAFAHRYSYSYTDGIRPLLFIQGSVAAGGFGNRVAFETLSGLFVIKDANDSSAPDLIFYDKQELFDYLWSGKLNDIQVSPFVEIDQSYSIGAMVTDEGAAVFGPRIQIIRAEDHSYRGWKIDSTTSSEDFLDLEIQLEASLKFALELHSRGFRGAFAEDLFEFMSPEGMFLTARAEANVRFDAVSFLTGVILRHEELGEKYMKGELSIRQEDHFEISSQVLEGRGALANEAFLNLLKENDIQLVGKFSPYGVILISPVSRLDEENHQVILAVIEKDDESRDALFERLKDLCNPAKTS